MMKEKSANCRLNWSFWLSIFAIVISTITLTLFFWKVTPYSNVDALTFIGVIAAFIGLSVTMLVGYQIYNAIDLRQRINAVERMKSSFEEQQNQIENLKMEQAEGFEIIQARLFHKTPEMEFYAFLHLHSALKYALSTNHKSEGYKWILDDLESYMLNITTASFSIVMHCLSPKEYIREVNKFKALYKATDTIIRKHANFLYIKARYEVLMVKFEKRLDNISNQRNVSSEKLDELL